MIVLLGNWFFLTAFMLFFLDVFMLMGFSMAYFTLLHMIKEIQNCEPPSSYNQSYCEFDDL